MAAALGYFYMVRAIAKHIIVASNQHCHLTCVRSYMQVAAWGGYIFIINIIPIYVVVMIGACHTLLLLLECAAAVFTGVNGYAISLCRRGSLLQPPLHCLLHVLRR